MSIFNPKNGKTIQAFDLNIGHIMKYDDQIYTATKIIRDLKYTSAVLKNTNDDVKELYLLNSDYVNIYEYKFD